MVTGRPLASQGRGGLAARLAEKYRRFAAFGVQEYPHALWNLMFAPCGGTDVQSSTVWPESKRAGRTRRFSWDLSRRQIDGLQHEPRALAYMGPQ